MNQEQKGKLVYLLHDTSFYLCGIYTITGKGKYFIDRLSNMIDEVMEIPVDSEKENTDQK